MTLQRFSDFVAARRHTLREREGEKYDCSAAKRFKRYRTKRSTKVVALSVYGHECFYFRTRPFFFIALLLVFFVLAGFFGRLTDICIIS
jgi:hypothetical protein